MGLQRIDVLLESVGRLARRGAVANALNILEKLRPVEVADVLRELPERERQAVFLALCDRDAAKAAEALSETGSELMTKLLGVLGGDLERIVGLLGTMSSDDAALVVEQLEDDLREPVLERLRVRHDSDVGDLLTFETETAGRIMSTDFFALQEGTTIAEAIASLQRRVGEFEMSFYIYVVDVRGHLLGVVSLAQLLLNTPSTPLKKLMTTDVIKVRTSTDQEEVARTVATYNLVAVPVVDDENKLVGIVTVDDVIDVIREEATEDIYALAGVDAEDRATGTALNSVRRRLPWLLISLGTSLLAAAVVHAFRESVSETIALAILIPVIATVSGNVGTQTMTVTVRGIGLSEVSWGHGMRILRKEAAVGLANGALLGLVSAAVVFAWFRDAALAAAVVLAVVANALVACVAGALIPVLLKRLRLDPATSSSAFVFSVTAILGLAIYFGIAEALIG